MSSPDGTRDLWTSREGLKDDDADVRNPVAICLKNGETRRADAAMLPANRQFLYYQPNRRGDPTVDGHREGPRFEHVRYDRVVVVSSPDGCIRDDGSGIWHYRHQYPDDGHLAALHNHLEYVEGRR